MNDITEVDKNAGDLAKEAVAHVLLAIAADPRKFWLMGAGTESYEKLTAAAAAAAMWNEPLERIRANYRPRKEKWDQYCLERDADQQLLEYCRDNGITDVT